MKITSEKIIKELVKNYGWDVPEEFLKQDSMFTCLISDTLKVIDDILIKEKGISIKGKKRL